MEDIEKVIKGLEYCQRREDGSCIGCPGDMECWCDKAIELLKKQLKTKVVFMRNSDGSFQTECGNCGTYLDKAYSRCPKCQKELDWNSNQT